MPFTAEVIDRLDLRLSASALTLSEMTDSPSARGGKRERLVASAGERLHRQGVAATTLADIAQAADVPVGNVHYYFRTKDDLVRAVIEAQLDQVEAAGPIRRILEWAEIQIRHLGRRDAAELAITLFAASKAVRCRPAPCATRNSCPSRCDISNSGSTPSPHHPHRHDHPVSGRPAQENRGELLSGAPGCRVVFAGGGQQFVAWELGGEFPVDVAHDR